MPLTVSTPSDLATPPRPGSHEVQFFSDDAVIVERILDHLKEAVLRGAAGIAFVAGARREALLASIAHDAGTASALASGHLVVLDAEATLARLMGRTVPDPQAFALVVGGLLDQALLRHGLVHAYGEMVDLLWARGLQEATLRLEELWTQAIAGRPVRLLCGYRLQTFSGGEHQAGFKRVCCAHDLVHPDAHTGADRQRIAELQQQAASFAEQYRQRAVAETALHRSEQFMARMLDSTQDSVMLLDLAGRLLSLNPAGLRALELADSTSLHLQEYAMMWSGHGHDLAKAALAAARAGGSGRFQGFCPTAGGTPKWWDVMVTPVLDAAGAPERLLVISRDLTELRQAMEALTRSEAESARRAAELERSNAELEQFAYVAAHDLKEPARMISTYLQLIEDSIGMQLPGEVRRHFDVVGASARRMLAMVQSLLAFSRIGRNGEPSTAVDLGVTLQLALAHLGDMVAASGAVFEISPLPTVRGSHEELIRLWQNLVANALTFRGTEAPRIHVEVEPLADEWLLRVRDNGIGIAQQEAGRLFQLFHRLHPAGRYPGTGIGLASCKKIVEHHGGRIWYESVPGRGTTFLFTLRR